MYYLLLVYLLQININEHLLSVKIQQFLPSLQIHIIATVFTISPELSRNDRVQSSDE